MRALLYAGADVDAQDSDSQLTALVHAAKCGGEHAEAKVRALVEAGANVTKNMRIVAQKGGRLAVTMVRLLVKAGADVNKQDEGGRTALMVAAEHGGEHAEAMMRRSSTRERRQQDRTGTGVPR